MGGTLPVSAATRSCLEGQDICFLELMWNERCRGQWISVMTALDMGRRSHGIDDYNVIPEIQLVSNVFVCN